MSRETAGLSFSRFSLVFGVAFSLLHSSTTATSSVESRRDDAVDIQQQMPGTTKTSSLDSARSPCCRESNASGVPRPLANPSARRDRLRATSLRSLSSSLTQSSRPRRSSLGRQSASFYMLRSPGSRVSNAAAAAGRCVSGRSTASRAVTQLTTATPRSVEVWNGSC
ncbi:hypothetical protein BD289DRAFT_143613 [Coniella lustricola]|uniref:Secreted protein n=1 Tax=Coniella lustricola TaxID=2025994 RepID=A0A2T3AEX4_9PEZI|nr:hypothetical protein BD289DRAFT_143613 [Coniella lustricola]